MKNVLRSLFVVLSLVSVLMVAGCKTDEEADEKVVAEKYRGTWYSWNTVSQTFQELESSWVIEKNSMTYYFPDGGKGATTKVWTIGTSLYNEKGQSGEFIDNDQTLNLSGDIYKRKN